MPPPKVPVNPESHASNSIRRATVQGLVIRLLIYCALTVGVASIYTAEGYLHGTKSYYAERSTVENVQSLFLLITAGLFFAAARLNGSWRGLCVVFGLMIVTAMVREQDSFFDNKVFDGAWQIVAGLILAVAGWWTWKRRKTIGSEIISYAETPGAGLIVAGMLTVAIFSRLTGRGSFWKSVTGDHYLRIIKSIVEEGTELFGYSLIMIAAAEAFIAERRNAGAKGQE